MGTHTVKVRVRLRWWLPLYVDTLVFFCTLFDREPDWEKFGKVVDRGIYLTVERCDG